MDKTKYLLAALDVVMRILDRQEIIREHIKTIKDKVTEMVTEDRDPTPEEWAALNLRLQQASDTLNSRADEARAILDSQP